MYDLCSANLQFLGFWKFSRNHLAGIQSYQVIHVDQAQFLSFCFEPLASIHCRQAMNAGLLCFGCSMGVYVIWDARQIDQLWGDNL